MHSQPGIRARGYAQSGSPRPLLFGGARHPFLVVLILLVWEETPWNSDAIRHQHNMSTLIRISAGHMRFVPAHKQSDEASPVLSPAKWPVELILIANHKGRETFVSHDRIQQITGPAIQATCLITAAQILFFPTPSYGG